MWRNGDQNEETFDLDGSSFLWVLLADFAASAISMGFKWWIIISKLNFCFIAVYTEVCVLKGTIVAYAF